MGVGRPVATATAGVAGMFFTWLTGKQARDDARAAATEARAQQRLENAYVKVLEVAERVGHWAHISYPLTDTTPPQPVPELPSLAEQAHAEALVRAFGSDEVRARMENWRSIVKEMLHNDKLIRQELEYQYERSPRVVFGELKPQEDETREALGNQVASELGHRTDAKPVRRPQE